MSNKVYQMVARSHGATMIPFWLWWLPWWWGVLDLTRPAAKIIQFPKPKRRK
jgi:hypothetical protein